MSEKSYQEYNLDNFFHSFKPHSGGSVKLLLNSHAHRAPRGVRGYFLFLWNAAGRNPAKFSFENTGKLHSDLYAVSLQFSIGTLPDFFLRPLMKLIKN